MLSRISNFTNLPMPLRVGVILVSGGGLFALTRYLLPPHLRWIILGGLMLVTFLIVLYVQVLKRMKKRKAKPMEQGVFNSGGATPQGVSEPERMARIDDLRKKFEDGVSKFQAAGKSLYSLPWYMVVGEPGSGKTEAVRHCNIGFPPGLHDQFQGVGGTINMNWWFTDHAVIVDTAGRLMFEEVEAGGSNEWKEFLNLLKKTRANCPINGVLLVIPADSLIKDSADEIEKKASKIAQQFDVIQRTLDVRFPVFVIITKSDLLNGFREFFDSLDDPQLQHQILGWSNPAPLDDPYNPKFVDQHLKAIRKRLFRRRLLLMQELMSDRLEDHEKPPVEALYAFPHSLAQLAPRMKRYLELIFSVGSQWSCKPLFFRGIYFTSSMQEGVALDEDLAQSLGVTVDSLPDGPVWKRDRAYFLRDLFMKKVFREHGLVTRATNAKKQHTRRKAVVLLSAVASVILLLFFTVYAAIGFRESIGKLNGYLVKAAADGPEFKNLQIIEPRSGNGCWYNGDKDVTIGEAEAKLGVKRYEYYSQLVDTVSLWETKGVPWVFAPAAKFAKNIKSESLRRAAATIYELGVLRPFYVAAKNKMENQEDGKWTQEGTETDVLRRLVRVKAEAKTPLNPEDRDEHPLLLDPFIQYIFGDNDYIPDLYGDQKLLLHHPLDVIYGDNAWATWPPLSLRTDDQLPVPAIEKGVNLFIKYWNQNLINDDNLAIKCIEGIKKSLEEFIAAEKEILLLYEDRDTGPDKLVSCNWFDRDNWSKNFNRLKRAKEDIDNYRDAIDNGSSLASSWRNATTNVLENIEASYKALLSEFQDEEPAKSFTDKLKGKLEEETASPTDKQDELKEEHVEKTTWIKEKQKELQEAIKNRKSELEDSQFKQGLEKLDRQCWTQSENPRLYLYEIRFEMYNQAYHAEKLLNASTAISPDPAKIPEIIRTTKRSVDDANDRIKSLSHDVGQDAFLLQEAKKFSAKILQCAEQEYQHSPENKKLISQYLAYRLERTGSEISTMISDMDLPKKNWETVHNEIKGLNIYDILDNLKDFGEPIEKELIEVFSIAPEEKEKIAPFQENLKKLSSKLMQNKFERILSNWSNLSDDSIKARDSLLNLKSSQFKYYVPPSHRSSSEFVDMYWYKLTYEFLRSLATQVQVEGLEEFKKLKLYGNKFPLKKDATKDLTLSELKHAHLLLDNILVSDAYAAETIGRGRNSNFGDEIAKELQRLRELPLPATSRKWLNSVKKVIQGLPETTESYYCKLTLLKATRANKETHLANYYREFEVVQGDERSERYRTMSAKDVAVDMPFRYPGKPVQIQFYQYPGESKPIKHVQVSGPWAPLRMLLGYSERNKPKGHIKLGKKQGLPGEFWLKLEFDKDRENDSPIDFPKVDEWPSLNVKY